MLVELLARLFLYRWVLVGIFLIGLVGIPIALMDDILGPGPKPPEDYGMALDPDSFRPFFCLYETPAGEVVDTPEPPQVVHTGQGGDSVVIVTSGKMAVFDKASGRTLNDHDKLIIAGLHPEDFNFERVGAHLRVCGKRFRVEVLLWRQYCYDDGRPAPWNNQIEEISFPMVYETWVADEVLEAGGGPKAFASPERIAELLEYGLPEAEVEEAMAHWKVRPLSELLPDSWGVSIACRNDLEREAERTGRPQPEEG